MLFIILLYVGSLKLSSPLNPPLWLSSNRAKEDRALHARLKEALERIRVKKAIAAALSRPTPPPAPVSLTEDATGVTDTIIEPSPIKIDSETSTSATSLDSRDGNQISLIEN